jgi:hypothetical protein
LCRVGPKTRRFSEAGLSSSSTSGSLLKYCMGPGAGREGARGEGGGIRNCMQASLSESGRFLHH